MSKIRTDRNLFRALLVSSTEFVACIIYSFYFPQKFHIRYLAGSDSPLAEKNIFSNSSFSDDKFKI